MTTLMVEPPAQSVEVEIEELKRRAAAHENLTQLKVDVKHVYRVWEAYESDVVMMVDGVLRQCAVIIFLDAERRPRTALIAEDNVVIAVGWGGDQRIARVKLTSDE